MESHSILIRKLKASGFESQKNSEYDQILVEMCENILLKQKTIPIDVNFLL